MQAPSVLFAKSALKCAAALLLLAMVLNAHAATFTDLTANYTSEVSNAPVLEFAISGTVFEDVNYGGGAGRDKATALSNGGSGRPNARVELYKNASSITFMTSTVTDASGNYDFPGLTPDSYTVRVVNSSVTSSRAGYVATLRSVQTFRTEFNPTGPDPMAVVIDHVGGQVPSKADAGNGSTTLDVLTTVTTTAQSITTVLLDDADIGGVDFGFNFNLIVNVNSAGQGSLRQFVANANTLGDGTLSIQGQAPGRDVSLFMIADGNTNPGLNTGMADLLTSGVAVIVLNATLTITSTMTLDGGLQTTLVGNTNPGAFGTGGTVGVDEGSLPLFNKPEVAIDANNFAALQLLAGASNVLVQNLAIYNASDAIQHRTGAGAGNTFRDLVIGATASGTDPGGVLRNTSAGIQVYTDTECAVEHCYIAHNATSGLLAVQPSATVTATYNEVFANGWNSDSHDGLDIDGRNCVVRFNLSHGALTKSGSPEDGGGSGLECGSTGYVGNLNNLFENNTLRDNTSQGATIRGGADGSTLRKNIITGNAIGVLVVQENRTANNNRITQNSIHSNSGIGIDLSNAASGGDGVTANDGAFNSAQSNNGIDSPTITAAVLTSGGLTVAGYVGSAQDQAVFAGAIVEFFIADNDISGYGEGRTYLGTLTTDASGNFSGTIATTDVASGDLITATATDGNGNTSEFGANKMANFSPTAICEGFTATVGSSGSVFILPADIDNGSFDSDGTITVVNVTPNMFNCADGGAHSVQLVVTDNLGATGTCTATVTITVLDSDGDGVCDALDLDNDNDGIPDVDEGGGNLIRNGDFEKDDFTDVIAYPDGFTEANGTFMGTTFNNNQLSNWHYDLNMDGWVGGATAFGGQFAPAFHGDQYIDIVGSSSYTGGVPNKVWQVIPTVPGKTYTLSFHWGEDVGNSTGEPVDIIAQAIDAADVILLNYTDTIIADGNVAGVVGPKHWYYAEANFTATTAQTKILFTCTQPAHNDGAGANLDQVSVNFTNLADCLDTDGDGIPDLLDLDSDNDGIYDLVEAGHGMADTDNNGMIDGVPAAFGTNGLYNGLETSADNGVLNYVIKDSNGDGKIDAIELDSDGDGCPDVIEAGFTDPDRDGVLGAAPLSVDGNGVVTSGGL